MKIEDVIDRSIVAIFRDPILGKKLVLKGGSALRLLENDRTRLSIDADFSVKKAITEERFFERMEAALKKEFGSMGLDVIDFLAIRRPSRIKKGFPEWWGGWLCQFKLLETTYRNLSKEDKRRRSIIPEGASSSKIELEISEHEYCGQKRRKQIKGVIVQGYSRELLILEKLRAICQQHIKYKFRTRKHRSRDFYDIYRLCSNMDDELLQECKKRLAPVFNAKKVPLELLKALWEKEFIEEQQQGFTQVVNTVRDNVYEFEVYLEHVRYLVLQIHPEVSK